MAVADELVTYADAFHAVYTDYAEYAVVAADRSAFSLFD